ncbi:hypothetical protein F5B20DRAFT_584318 [Whalleya microplaca]|nr:hypothetical protein F5B20DRAFT_584318 [Whalleya microplaca]
MQIRALAFLAIMATPQIVLADIAKVDKPQTIYDGTCGKDPDGQHGKKNGYCVLTGISSKECHPDHKRMEDTATGLTRLLTAWLFARSLGRYLKLDLIVRTRT